MKKILSSSAEWTHSSSHVPLGASLEAMLQSYMTKFQILYFYQSVNWYLTEKPLSMSLLLNYNLLDV